MYVKYNANCIVLPDSILFYLLKNTTEMIHIYNTKILQSLQWSRVAAGRKAEFWWHCWWIDALPLPGLQKCVTEEASYLVSSAKCIVNKTFSFSIKELAFFSSEEKQWNYLCLFCYHQILSLIYIFFVSFPWIKRYVCCKCPCGAWFICCIFDYFFF